MEENAKTICLNFKQELDRFTDSIHTLSRDGGLAHQDEFVCQMADRINKLYDSSVSVLQCNDEEFKEIGALVQNIFMQPVTTKEKKQLTMKHAVESFSDQNARESELYAILREYTIYPESTKSFIRELELLSEDLDSALKDSA